jgi:hypothetical protein
MSLFITISTVSALDECEEIETASQNCEVVTPVLECATYDLYNPSHVLDTDDGGMTQIGTTGVYYFTFNEATEGDWTILLCSNHTTVITVETKSTWDEISAINSSITGVVNTVNTNLISINGTLYTRIGDINSSISSLITTANNNLISINGTLYAKIDAINTSIMTNEDDTQTMLSSVNSTLYNEVDTLEENLTRYGSNVTWIGDSIWLYDGSKEIDITNVTVTVNASVTVNNTAIASAVWDYNLTKAGYSTTNTGVAGSIQRYIALTVTWIERLIS